jgi:hypothetical protein
MQQFNCIFKLAHFQIFKLIINTKSLPVIGKLFNIVFTGQLFLRQEIFYIVFVNDVFFESVGA